MFDSYSMPDFSQEEMDALLDKTSESEFLEKYKYDDYTETW